MSKYWVANEPNAQVTSAEALRLKDSAKIAGVEYSASAPAGVTATAFAHQLGSGIMMLKVAVSGLGVSENITINTPVAFNVLDAKIHTTTHVASRTLQVKNNTTAVSSTMASATKGIARATTIDAAQYAFAKDDNDLVISAAGGTGDWAGFVYLELHEV